MKASIGFAIILSGCVMTTGRGAPTRGAPAGGAVAADGRAPGEAPPPSAGEGEAPPPSSDGKRVVPNLIGKTLDEARVLVQRAGFTAEVETSRPVECDGAGVPGKIKCQDPQPGEHASAYAAVQVQVYAPHAQIGVNVDRLKGLSIPAAKTELARQGFTGEINVDEASDGDYSNCKFDVVCIAYEHGDSVHLDVRRRVKISAPPPE